MIRIPESKYEKYIALAGANKCNQVYPLSIAEGYQSGDIFADTMDPVNTALFWHYCGFAYLSGIVRTGFLDEVYEEFFLKEQKRRFLLITDDLTVIRFFSGKPEIETGCRIIPSFSWESDERFLDKGFGYVAIEGNTIAGVAFSAAVSSAEADIGVETVEQYRNKGFATILADRMCREIRCQGKKPVWAHARQNTGSGKIALNCGFLECKRNTVIKKG